MSKIINTFCIAVSVVILVGVVYVANTSSKEVRENRNAQRQKDVESIMRALKRYERVTGEYPSSLPVSTQCFEKTHEICRTNINECSGLVDLSSITSEKRYLVTIPTDPTAVNERGTGYFVASESGKITVCAPATEDTQKISITE